MSGRGYRRASACVWLLFRLCGLMLVADSFIHLGIASQAGMGHRWPAEYKEMLLEHEALLASAVQRNGVNENRATPTPGGAHLSTPAMSTMLRAPTPVASHTVVIIVLPCLSPPQ